MPLLLHCPPGAFQAPFNHQNSMSKKKQQKKSAGIYSMSLQLTLGRRGKRQSCTTLTVLLAFTDKQTDVRPECVTDGEKRGGA